MQLYEAELCFRDDRICSPQVRGVAGGCVARRHTTYGALSVLGREIPGRAAAVFSPIEPRVHVLRAYEPSESHSAQGTARILA